MRNPVSQSAVEQCLSPTQYKFKGRDRVKSSSKQKVVDWWVTHGWSLAIAYHASPNTDWLQCTSHAHCYIPDQRGKSHQCNEALANNSFATRVHGIKGRNWRKWWGLFSKITTFDLCSVNSSQNKPWPLNWVVWTEPLELIWDPPTCFKISLHSTCLFLSIQFCLWMQTLGWRAKSMVYGLNCSWLSYTLYAEP